jgi:hypothetical protein
LVLLPHLFWNVVNHWPTAQHTLEITVQETGSTVAQGAGGWRRLASALWTGPESEALDGVLCTLPRGSRLAVPMYDGLLLTCAREDADRVAGELRTSMRRAARAAGFDAGVKIGVGATWAEAEEGAR